jgi:hypothetical protein
MDFLALRALRQFRLRSGSAISGCRTCIEAVCAFEPKPAPLRKPRECSGIYRSLCGSYVLFDASFLE